MNKSKKSVYKSGKVKVSLYEGVVTISELKNMNYGKNVLPLGIILDGSKLDTLNKYGNDLTLKRLLSYYENPKKQEDINTIYMQLDLDKLSRDFYDDKLFIDTITYCDGKKKIVDSLTPETKNVIIGVTDKRRLFNRKKNIENVSLSRLSYLSMYEYLKEIRKRIVLTKDEIDEIHKRGNVTIEEIVREWESNDLCMPADTSGNTCRKFGNCHDCLVDYASYSLEHSPMSSYLRLTNLEDFPPLDRADLTLYEFYDTKECISGFFDTEDELNLYINASGNEGLRFKLEFFYNKDGINNVVKETNEKGEESFYRIIDEETCVFYSTGDESMCKPVSLVDWPITDVLIRKGITLAKDKCKVKE